MPFITSDGSTRDLGKLGQLMASSKSSLEQRHFNPMDPTAKTNGLGLDYIRSDQKIALSMCILKMCSLKL